MTSKQKQPPEKEGRLGGGLSERKRKGNKQISVIKCLNILLFPLQYSIQCNKSAAALFSNPFILLQRDKFLLRITRLPWCDVTQSMKLTL